jgi:hypothetical protein
MKLKDENDLVHDSLYRGSVLFGIGFIRNWPCPKSTDHHGRGQRLRWRGNGIAFLQLKP